MELQLEFDLRLLECRSAYIFCCNYFSVKVATEFRFFEVERLGRSLHTDVSSGEAKNTLTK